MKNWNDRGTALERSVGTFVVCVEAGGRAVGLGKGS